MKKWMDKSEAIVPSVVVMYLKPEGRRHQTVWIGMQNIVIEQECAYSMSNQPIDTIILSFIGPKHMSPFTRNKNVQESFMQAALRIKCELSCFSIRFGLLFNNNICLVYHNFSYSRSYIVIVN